MTYFIITVKSSHFRLFSTHLFNTTVTKSLDFGSLKFNFNPECYLLMPVLQKYLMTMPGATSNFHVHKSFWECNSLKHCTGALRLVLILRLFVLCRFCRNTRLSLSRSPQEGALWQICGLMGMW